MSINDQITVERIDAMIADLQAQKVTLHPEQTQQAAAVGASFILAIGRPPESFIYTLEGALRCRKCRRFKQIEFCTQLVPTQATSHQKNSQ